MVTAARGQTQNLVVEDNDAQGGVRAFFDLVGEGDGNDQLRLGLKGGKGVESETWVYDYQK